MSHLNANSSWAGTLELDTFNSDRLILISNVETFDFLLNPLFFLSLPVSDQ